MKKLAVASFSLLLVGCASMNHQDVGTLSGGVIGGLIGSQFGGGSGKVIAAAGGALLGAYLGGQIGKTMDRQDRLDKKIQRTLHSDISWHKQQPPDTPTKKPLFRFSIFQQIAR